jgi:signal transduction histidine kinase
MRRLGITAKLVVHSAWILMGLGLAITAYSVSQLKQLLYHEMVRRVEAQTSNWIAANTSQIILSGSPETLQRLAKELRKKEGIAYVILLDPDGGQTAGIDLPAGLAEERPSLRQETASSRWTEMKDAQGLRYFQLANRISASGTGMSADLEAMFELAAKRKTLGEVRVGVDRQEYDRRVGALVWRNVALGTILVLLALVASSVFANRMVTPITSMGKVANQIAAGKLSERVERGTQLQDEVGDLVRNFNQMATRLEENQEEMRVLHSGLEEKVRERTMELEHANIRLQELDQLKSKFLSTVSHELRTPLTSIKAFAEILLDSRDSNHETQKRFLGIINEESDRLSRLISDLLDLTKIESGGATWLMKSVDLREIVGQSKELLAPHVEEKKIQLNVVESHPVLVWADSDRVKQVITNLIGNAIKFGVDGGKVEIRLDRAIKSGPHKGLKGDYAVVVVADDGPGIPAEDRERIFEPFFQGASHRSSGSGTGLGLAICREIVLHHKGEVWFKSELGVGSEFYFTVPLSSSGSVAAVSTPGKHAAGGF